MSINLFKAEKKNNALKLSNKNKVFDYLNLTSYLIRNFATLP